MVNLQRIIELYINITKDCLINQLGPPFTYYLSDELSTNILSNNLIELDIQSAFPSICRMYFGESHPFVQNIYKIEDKLERNIYISTTLTEQSKIDNKNYLQEVNLWTKIIILGYTYSRFDNINILEYKKDGCIIKAEEKSNKNSDINEFLDTLGLYKINFHIDNIATYVHFNKTSIIDYSIKQLDIKGKYKNMPLYIKELIIKLIKGEVYNNDVLYKVKEIYNDLFYSILYKSKFWDLIKYYYGFEEKDKSIKYLNQKGDLVNSLNNKDLLSYLRSIIFPLLILFRTSKRSS